MQMNNNDMPTQFVVPRTALCVALAEDYLYIARDENNKLVLFSTQPEASERQDPLFQSGFWSLADKDMETGKCIYFQDFVKEHNMILKCPATLIDRFNPDMILPMVKWGNGYYVLKTLI